MNTGQKDESPTEDTDEVFCKSNQDVGLSSTSSRSARLLVDSSLLIASRLSTCSWISGANRVRSKSRVTRAPAQFGHGGCEVDQRAGRRRLKMGARCDRHRCRGQAGSGVVAGSGSRTGAGRTFKGGLFGVVGYLGRGYQFARSR